MNSNKARIGLVALDLFMAIQAAFGGITLLTGVLEAPHEWLDHGPFTSITIPALILAVVVGGSSLGAAVILVRDRFLGGAASVAAGCVVVGWIVGEMYMVPPAWLQPFEAGIGLLMIAFGSLLAADPARLTALRRPHLRGGLGG